MGGKLIGLARQTPRLLSRANGRYGLVDLLHDIGMFIVVEEIETEEQARLSQDCDADFVRGYYFARPSVDIVLHVRRGGSGFVLSGDVLFERLSEVLR